ncbi:MAG: hypothetical protein CVV07_07625 [Gammaproteobacteria bacterium HGW-Gammaproteobacteria-11]|nr:MAG: hypothetical protein CVV07_07625 [Gammaproteobacteria bacterium HGW-Gammaproteobacteria-11]
MKLLSRLLLTSLFVVAAMPASACSMDDAVAKAEQVAETINRLAQDDPQRAEAMNAQLIELQQRDPTRSDHGACEAYDRIIRELEEHFGNGQ